MDRPKCCNDGADTTRWQDGRRGHKPGEEIDGSGISSSRKGGIKRVCTRRGGKARARKRCRVTSHRLTGSDLSCAFANLLQAQLH